MKNLDEAGSAGVTLIDEGCVLTTTVRALWSELPRVLPILSVVNTATYLVKKRVIDDQRLIISTTLPGYQVSQLAH